MQCVAVTDMEQVRKVSCIVILKRRLAVTFATIILKDDDTYEGVMVHISKVSLIVF